jgi:hypothetical protein
MFFTPSEAEGWIPSEAEVVVFMYQISRLGFARRAVCAKASAHRAELKNSPRPTGTPQHEGNEIHLLYYSFYLGTEYTVDA